MIYIKFGDTQGSATAANYEGWCDANSMHLDINRDHDMNVGNIKTLVTSSAKFSPIMIQKTTDKASIDLFNHAYNHKVIPKVTINVCTDGNTKNKFVEYVLTDAVVIKYQDSISHSGKPTETIYLAYKKIEKTVTPVDKNGNPVSPIRTGFDLKTAQKL